VPEKKAGGMTTAQLEMEQRILERIRTRRRKLLWPGVFTALSISGIYCGFAYLDERFDLQDRNLTALAERSQSWYFTPTLIKEGVVNGWRELDKMTIGLVALYVGLHLTKKLPHKFWTRLAHIAGEKEWTLLTYAWIHQSNMAMFASVLYLVWFMPTLMRYFDGDYLHALAFYASVPILLGFFTHLQFRGRRPTQGFPIEMGSSGVVLAVVGAYTAINPWEKVWFPWTGPFRIDAIYFTGVLAANEIYRVYKSHRKGLPKTVSHSVSVLHASWFDSG
jgi:hypothetical protein